MPDECWSYIDSSSLLGLITEYPEPSCSGVERVLCDAALYTMVMVLLFRGDGDILGQSSLGRSRLDGRERSSEDHCAKNNVRYTSFNRSESIFSVANAVRVGFVFLPVDRAVALERRIDCHPVFGHEDDGRCFLRVGVSRRLWLQFINPAE